MSFWPSNWVLTKGSLVYLRKEDNRKKKRMASSIAELVAPLLRKAWRVSSWPLMLIVHWTRISTKCPELQILGVLIKTKFVSSWSKCLLPLGSYDSLRARWRFSISCSIRLVRVSRINTRVSSSKFCVLPWTIWVYGCQCQRVVKGKGYKFVLWKFYRFPFHNWWIESTSKASNTIYVFLKYPFMWAISLIRS